MNIFYVDPISYLKYSQHIIMSQTQRGLGTWHDIYPYFIVSDGFSTRIQNGWPLHNNIKYVIHQGIYHIKTLSKGKTCISGIYIM